MLLKVDKYYDMHCSICGFNRSTDFEKGMDNNLESIRKMAYSEGWRLHNGKMYCPNCEARYTQGKDCS